MNNNNNNGGILHIVSWVCLLVGWVFGLGLIIFPIGMATATSAQKDGQDTSLARTLNKISFGIQIALFVIGFFIGFMLF